MIDRATESAIAAFLKTQPEWAVQAGKLHREYVFADFTVAMQFVTQAAAVAGEMDHHPEWQNVYKTVTVDLTTHEAGGISERDFALAQRLEAIAANLSG